ncbi:MAG: NADH-quinone oxidoreductase subunit L [Anaerolineales bacterium]|nr:NADH-quinone oxidoreductase subunit L [Anaerolineales bacterium]
MYGIAPLLLVFPLLGFLFNALVGRRFTESSGSVGEKWSGWAGTTMALASFAVAVTLALSLAANEFHSGVVTMFDWFNIASASTGFTFHIPWAIQVDTLSVTMMLVVTGVGSLIHIYAIGYMHGDKDFNRFFAYLNLFLFFMLILVSGNTYLMLFVGWEGVGLCSFLLIGFWFQEWKNADAARKAFVANRVGDLAMILGMILTFWTFGSLEFEPVFAHAVEMFEHPEVIHIAGLQMSFGAMVTAICVLFLVGATGKSAQIPLFVWLPDAMAGPTPVSALIHAATMVTSGIYLIVRSSVLFELARESEAVSVLGLSAPDLVAYIGAATALYAGLIAFTQYDIKKVLAYSTVSQLGFMIAAVGMGAYVAGMFHLITHAFFKALLFLGSGSIIHGMEHGHHALHHDGHGDGHHEDHFDPQDMRTMGGLRDKMPRTFWTYMVGALALSGIFPLAGFWSKDEILAHATEHNQIVYWILTVAAVCTAFYMGRQLKMVFFGQPRHAAAEHVHESDNYMTTPLVILAILAILGGLLNLPFFGGGEHEPEGVNLMLEQWLHHSLEVFHLSEEGVIHLPHTPTSLQLSVAAISTVLAVGALALAFFVVYGNKPVKATDRDPLQSTPIWWMSVLPLNTLYMNGLVPLFNRLSHFLGITVDWLLYHDFFYEKVLRDPFIAFSRFSARTLDANGVDGIVRGSGKLTVAISDGLRRFQTGFVRNYALGVFIGVVALIAYFVFQALG